ncbi:MAG: AAA family ATPase, partial [Rhodoferax sp.]|uniref:AAA family ATPase n=1 Tax=Rhodoferax sp. TaxID=50421 RepID=UPI0026074727
PKPQKIARERVRIPNGGISPDPFCSCGCGGLVLGLVFQQPVKSNRLRLIEALRDNSKNEFKNLIISKLESLDDDSSYDLIYGNKLKTLLWNMMRELRLEQLLLRSVNLLTEKFNNYLIDNKRLQILNDKVFVGVDGRELPVSDLSSGERHILTFLTLVLFQGRQRNFLIIDEPEISLNIKWQRELMGLLHDLAPNTQIIVASHSPVLAKRNPSFLAELTVVKGEL